MSEWPPERIEELKRLNADGKTSAQIGEIMGVGRGAICGKLWRLNMRGESPGAARRIRKRTIKRAAVKAETRRNGAGYVGPVRAPQPVPIPLAGAKPKGYKQIMALKSRDCRYVVSGELAGAWYCAAATEDGQSYCDRHRSACYAPTGTARELERGLRRYSA